MDPERRDDGCSHGREVSGIVPCNDRHGGCVDAVLSVDFGGGAAGEEFHRDHFEKGMTEDLAEVHSRDAFFKHLEARVVAVFINFCIIVCILHDVELSNQNLS